MSFLDDFHGGVCGWCGETVTNPKRDGRSSGSSGSSGERMRTLIEQAMHLVEHGERAPGGTETWMDWYRRARAELEAS